MSSTTCAPGLRRCYTTTPITRRPPPCALPSLPRQSAPKPPGASRPPASPTTACRCTASKACLPISPPMRGSRRPPRSTTNTSSRSTPGQLRSSSAPSSSSPSTRIVPSKSTRARYKQQRAHCLIDSKRRKFGLVLSRSHIAEQKSRDLALLDFLAAFGDAVAAVMAVDVLKRLVARVTHAAMHLHGAVGGLAAQPVRPKIAHRNLVGERVLDLRLREFIHFPSGLADQQPQHFGLRRQLHQRPLDRLVLGQRAAERLALP